MKATQFVSTAGGIITSPKSLVRSSACPTVRRFEMQDVSLTTIMTAPVLRRLEDRRRDLPGRSGRESDDGLTLVVAAPATHLLIPRLVPTLDAQPHTFRWRGLSADLSLASA